MIRVKTGPVIAIAFLVACFLVAAGCSGTSGTKTAAEKTNQSWAGYWMTEIRHGDNRTPMDLTQTGIVVTGSYGYADGTIVGTSQNGRLSGTWSEEGGRSTGPVEFVLSDNGLSFSGWWAYPDEDFDAIREGPALWWGSRT